MAMIMNGTKEATVDCVQVRRIVAHTAPTVAPRQKPNVIFPWNSKCYFLGINLRNYSSTPIELSVNPNAAIASPAISLRLTLLTSAYFSITLLALL